MTAIDAEIRLYDNLFDTPEPDLADCNYLEHLRSDSLTIIHGAKLEASLAEASVENRYQFMRLGYFCQDRDSRPDHLIYNRSVSLKDSFRG